MIIILTILLVLSNLLWLIFSKPNKTLYKKIQDLSEQNTTLNAKNSVLLKEVERLNFELELSKSDLSKAFKKDAIDEIMLKKPAILKKIQKIKKLKNGNKKIIKNKK